LHGAARSAGTGFGRATAEIALAVTGTRAQLAVKRAAITAHTRTLNALRQDQLDARAETAALRIELKAEIAELREETRRGFATMREGMAGIVQILGRIERSG
jgi:hypothetical protein